MTRSTLLLLLIEACGGDQERPGGEATDADGDGLAGSLDCDDGDPTVGGPATWYADADGDGFGDPAAETLGCGLPDGYTADASDCDDGDAAVNPAASELCDDAGVDEDCDGLVNGDDGDATGGTPFYPDLDGDGWGDSAGEVVACDNPGGWVGVGGDCDDEAPAVSPGETERCDGVDDDCDPASTEDGLVTLDGLTGFSTVQDAVDAASVGSVVAVCAGTWAEAVTIDRDLVLWGVAGPDRTILDASGGESALTVTGGAVTVSGFTLTGGAPASADTTTRGGGLNARHADAVTVEDCVVTGNAATYGGGVYGSREGSTLLRGTRVEGNTASGSGGGLYLVNASFDGVAVEGNEASYGGGLYVEEGVLDGLDLTVAGNAAGYGGGAYLGGSFLDGATFSGNAASERGGGVYLRGGGALTDARVEANTAESYGGGLFVLDGGALEGVEVSGNEAGSGGGLLVDGETVELVDVTVTGNTAASAGGGVYAYDVELALERVAVSANEATWGAGVYLQAAALLGDGDSGVTGNTASGGGGIYVYDEGAEIDDLAVSGNAASDGGGIYAHGPLLIHALDLEGNAADAQGGALYTGAAVELVASSLVGNAAQYGAGIYVTNAASVTLSDCALTENAASSFGGGARVISGTLTSADCDWGEGGDDNDPDDVTVGYGATVAYEGFGGAASFTCSSETGTCE